MLRFFVCVVFFLLERDRKRKNYECDRLGNLIPYKIMFVFISANLVKNCGSRCIFNGHSAIFHGEGKTHRVINQLCEKYQRKQE